VAGGVVAVAVVIGGAYYVLGPGKSKSSAAATP
jgi:hypothetical protein